MGKTRNKSNKSRGHKSEKDSCFPDVEGQPINEASEQQLPPRPELLLDDFVWNDDHDKEEEATYGGYGGLTQRKSRGNHSDV